MAPRTLRTAKQAAMNALDDVLGTGCHDPREKIIALRDIESAAHRMARNLEHWHAAQITGAAA